MGKLRRPSCNHLPWDEEVSARESKVEDDIGDDADPCRDSNVGKEEQSDGLASLEEAEEEEFYDFIMCFKEGNYHVAEVVAISQQNPSQVEATDGDCLVEEGGGSFYDAASRETRSHSSENMAEQWRAWDIASVANLTATPRRSPADNGVRVGAKQRVSHASFSWMLNGPNSVSSWAFHSESCSFPLPSNGSDDCCRSSFTFPHQSQIVRIGSPGSEPKPRGGRRRHKILAWKPYFLCCRF